VLDYDEHRGTLPGDYDFDETLDSDVLSPDYVGCAISRSGLGYLGVGYLR
jgi:hypothetical protein